MIVGLARYDWPSTACFPPTAFADSQTERVAIVRPIVSAPVPKWTGAVALRLKQLLDLGRDWDNRGSAAVRRDALVFAAEILCQTMPPAAPAPSIIPLGHGGVQLVWSNATAEIEVEVVQPNEAIIYFIDRQSEEDCEIQTETDFSKLATLLRNNFA